MGNKRWETMGFWVLTCFSDKAIFCVSIWGWKDQAAWKKPAVSVQMNYHLLIPMVFLWFSYGFPMVYHNLTFNNWKITMLLIGKPSINGPSIPWLCWITRGYHINSYYTWTMGVELLILFLRSRRWNKMNLHDLCARKWMKMLISAQPSRWKTGPACSGSSPGFGLRIRPSNHDSNASWCPFLAATESNTANTLWCIGKYRKI